MDLEHLKDVLRVGDVHGAALREILEFYGVADRDLNKISNEQVEEWLARRCKNDGQNNCGNKTVQH